MVPIELSVFSLLRTQCDNVHCHDVAPSCLGWLVIRKLFSAVFDDFLSIYPLGILPVGQTVYQHDCIT